MRHLQAVFVFAAAILATLSNTISLEAQDTGTNTAEVVTDSSAVQTTRDSGSGESVEKLIAQLDSDKFHERRAAEQQLLRLGKQAVPAMQAAFEQATGEPRVRLGQILQDLRRSIRLIETQTVPSLDCVTSAEISTDGRFLYSAAWKANALSVFEIGSDTGRLSFIESLQDAADFNGAVAIRLSSNNELAAAVAFRAKTVTLFRRNANTGKLTRLHTVKPDPAKPSLTFPIDAAFSPDGKYLYVLDTQFEGVGTRGAVFVYHVTNHDTLEFVEFNVGQSGCFNDARGIVFHPQRDQFYVASSSPGALVCVDWDRQTGMTKVRQVLRDEKDGIGGLSGAMSVALSQDGKFLYCSSGRFQGDSAIGVYRVADDGTLRVIEEFISGRDPMGNFLGGNELLVSPDGVNVYATGTRSATLVGFARDAETGKLKFIETVALGRDLGPAGLAIRADGAYLYIAVEGSSGLAVFRRD